MTQTLAAGGALPDDCWGHALGFLRADELAPMSLQSRSFNERVQALCLSRLAKASRCPLIGSVVGRIAQHGIAHNVRYSAVIARMNNVMRHLLPDQWQYNENFEHIEHSLNAAPAEDIAHVLKQAARDAHCNRAIELAQDLLSLADRRRINMNAESTASEIIRGIVATGHLELVRTLLACDCIEDVHVAMVLWVAAIHSCPSIVREILCEERNSNRITAFDVREAFRLAIHDRQPRRGYDEAISEMIADNRITSGDVRNGLLSAARTGGCASAVRAILLADRTSNYLTEDAVREAFWSGLRESNCGVVGAILDEKSCCLTDNDVREGFWWAMRADNFLDFEAILRADRSRCLTEVDVRLAFWWAIQMDNSLDAKVILNNHRLSSRLSETDVRLAFWSVLEEEEFPDVRAFLSNDHMSDDDVRAAFCFAATEECASLLKNILGADRSRCLSDDDVREGFQCAIQEGSAMGVRVMLCYMRRRGCLTDNDLREGFRCAIEREHFDVSEAILRADHSSCLTDGALRAFFRVVIAAGNVMAIRAILRNDRISRCVSDEEVRKAFRLGAGEKNAAIIRAILLNERPHLKLDDIFAEDGGSVFEKVVNAALHPYHAITQYFS